MAKGEHMTSEPRRAQPTLHPSRATTLTVALALVAAVTLWASPSQAQGTGDWLHMVNELRASHGLAPLRLDGNLSSLAQRWSDKMAADGKISHDPDLAGGVTANWSKLGENVGTGSDRRAIMRAFVNSPPHLANLIDPQFTDIGIGSTFVGDREYVVHRFMALAGGASGTAGSSSGDAGGQDHPGGSDGRFGVSAPRADSPRPSTTVPAPSPEPEPPAPPQATPPPAEARRVAAVLSALRDATG